MYTDVRTSWTDYEQSDFCHPAKGQSSLLPQLATALFVILWHSCWIIFILGLRHPCHLGSSWVINYLIKSYYELNSITHQTLSRIPNGNPPCFDSLSQSNPAHGNNRKWLFKSGCSLWTLLSKSQFSFYKIYLINNNTYYIRQRTETFGRTRKLSIIWVAHQNRPRSTSWKYFYWLSSSTCRPFSSWKRPSLTSIISMKLWKPIWDGMKSIPACTGDEKCC